MNSKSNETIIAVSSITYAIKAKDVLESYGYSCKIVRTPKDLSKGCGYSIIVKDNIKIILSILKNEGIKYKDYRAQ